MGITMTTFGGLFGSLQSALGWLVQPPSPQPRQVRRAQPPVRPAATKTAAVRPCASWPFRAGEGREHPRRPLRVLRVVEGPQAPAQAGRMVISGRMADVCAELDRLAALEG